jgi:glycosyltransferase involved in cell wall biosynthesis
MDGAADTGKEMDRIDRVEGRIPVIVQGDFDPMGGQMFGISDELLLAAAGRDKGPRVSIKEDVHGNGFSCISRYGIGSDLFLRCGEEVVNWQCALFCPWSGRENDPWLAKRTCVEHAMHQCMTATSSLGAPLQSCYQTDRNSSNFSGSPFESGRLSSIAVIRVLHAYKGYMPELTGGIPEVISLLSRSMGPDMESRVIVCRRGGRRTHSNIDGIAVEEVRSWGQLLSMPFALTFPIALKRAARNVELVVAHLPFPLNDVGIALGLPDPVALVVHWHSDILGRRAVMPFVAPLIRHTLSRADRIVVSDASMISNSRFLGPHEGKCSIVPFGTDVDYWDRLDSREQIEVEHLRQAHPRLVVATGRLVPYKGFSTLIRALQDVDATLVIIGDGPMQSALGRLAKRLGVAERVLLKGFLPRDQLKIYLRAARVFAFPSITSAETFGIAQIEAMAAGLPIVNTALPTGVPKVARHGAEAITVPPNDPGALAAAIGQLLDDALLTRRLGQAGLTRARAEYGLDEFVTRMKRVYLEARAGRGRAPKKN